MQSKEGGVSLIEVLIAAVIVVIMILAIMETITAGRDAASMGGANLAVQTANTRCMAEMTRWIRESRVFGIAPDGSWIRLQAPVDHDGDGDVLDDNREVQWGANGKLNWYLEYAFHTEPGNKEWIFDEAKQGRNGMDLNRDGDAKDGIEIGYIMEKLMDENGVEVSSRQLTPRCMVLDLDADGLRDPLFKRLYPNGTDDPDGPGPQVPDNDGPMVRISFWSFRMAEKDRRVLLHPTSTVGTRNF